jgi:hypothetical protein
VYLTSLIHKYGSLDGIENKWNTSRNSLVSSSSPQLTQCPQGNQGYVRGESNLLHLQIYSLGYQKSNTREWCAMFTESVVHTVLTWSGQLLVSQILHSGKQKALSEAPGNLLPIRKFGSSSATG